jgi:hypothetical protein
MGNAGQTLVKLSPDGFAMLAVDAKTTAQTGILFEVRRDVPNQAALNGTTTVVFKQDTSVIGAYNRANKKAFIELPANLATVTGVSAGTLTVTLGPGEFAKSVIVSIPNSANFDFSKSYALGFRMMSVSGEGAISQNVGTTIFAQVLAKNKYDGKYKMKGFIMRPGDTSGLEGFFSGFDHKLSTSGATACTLSPNQMWANGGGVGGIGTWTITVIETGTPPYAITVYDPVAVNWLMDPTYPNRYDPVTKTFYFKVNWGAAIPYTRGCTDTLVYVGPQK